MAVNTTKTYNFNPSAGSLMLTAFHRCGVRPTELTQAHVVEGQKAGNFVLVELSNLQPNLWEIELVSLPLLESVGTYSLPAEIVMITDMYLTIGESETGNDRYMMALSRTEYAQLPNKELEGTPAQFWFSRLISPTVSFWPVPDGNGPYIARYFGVRQTQDANLADGRTVEIPYRFLEAYVAGMAWKLAEIFAPQLEDKLFTRYTRALQIATTQDVENVGLTIAPMIGGYYNR